MYIINRQIKSGAGCESECERVRMGGIMCIEYQHYFIDTFSQLRGRNMRKFKTNYTHTPRYCMSRRMHNIYKKNLLV